MGEYIKIFWEEMSNRCKAYTIVALVIFLFFVGIDVCEYVINQKAETEIEYIGNSVSDSLEQEIESLDTHEQEIVEPIKNMSIIIKPRWIKLSLVMFSLIIGELFARIKKPVEEIKSIMSDEIRDETDEPKMWIPFMILVLIDIMVFF